MTTLFHSRESSASLEVGLGEYPDLTALEEWLEVEDDGIGVWVR